MAEFGQKLKATWLTIHMDKQYAITSPLDKHTTRKNAYFRNK